MGVELRNRSIPIHHSRGIQYVCFFDCLVSSVSVLNEWKLPGSRAGCLFNYKYVKALSVKADIPIVKVKGRIEEKEQHKFAFFNRERTSRRCLKRGERRGKQTMMPMPGIPKEKTEPCKKIIIAFVWASPNRSSHRKRAMRAALTLSAPPGASEIDAMRLDGGSDGGASACWLLGYGAGYPRDKTRAVINY